MLSMWKFVFFFFAFRHLGSTETSWVGGWQSVVFLGRGCLQRASGSTSSLLPEYSQGLLEQRKNFWYHASHFWEPHAIFAVNRRLLDNPERFSKAFWHRLLSKEYCLGALEDQRILNNSQAILNNPLYASVEFQLKHYVQGQKTVGSLVNRFSAAKKGSWR